MKSNKTRKCKRCRKQKIVYICPCCLETRVKCDCSNKRLSNDCIDLHG